MKLHSIETPIGAAMLASIEAPIHPLEAPPGWGLILWGKCEAAELLSVALGSNTDWIAYCERGSQEAIVVYPADLAGKRFEINTTPVDAICPECGSTHYVSTGVNWKCKECDRQWRKSPGKRGRPAKKQ